MPPADLIARLKDPALATETLLSLDDLALVARVKETAARDGLTAGAFAAQAIEHLAAHADDETWLTLIGLMNGSADPGQVLLHRALRDAVSRSLDHTTA
ncbi:MAG: hypothetical protein Q8P46_07950 [Hyphomicrobiales bacterium]|nr:hypothetical protein [Hyphomicrobiales bacterium]